MLLYKIVERYTINDTIFHDGVIVLNVLQYLLIHHRYVVLLSFVRFIHEYVCTLPCDES